MLKREGCKKTPKRTPSPAFKHPHRDRELAVVDEEVILGLQQDLYPARRVLVSGIWCETGFGSHPVVQQDLDPVRRVLVSGVQQDLDLIQVCNRISISSWCATGFVCCQEGPGTSGNILVLLSGRLELLSVACQEIRIIIEFVGETLEPPVIAMFCLAFSGCPSRKIG
jgi:hypothetical protein